MIIINGAGSKLAQNFIAINYNKEIIAISRKATFNFENVRTVNLLSNEELRLFLKTIEEQEIIWINFQAIKYDELLVNTSILKMEESFNINYYKNFIAVQSLLPKMIKKRFGRFIFIDSVKAMMGDVGCAAYAISKGANRPLMQSIVCEYSRFNITCNTIAVGYAETPMLDKVSEKKRNEFLREIPGKKLVDTKDLDSVINLLIANESINGQIINLDGGLRNSG